MLTGLFVECLVKGVVLGTVLAQWIKYLLYKHKEPSLRILLTPHKSWIWRCEPVIPVLGRWRSNNPGGLLARQLSQPQSSRFNERPYFKGGREGDPLPIPGLHMYLICVNVCVYACVSVPVCVYICEKSMCICMCMCVYVCVSVCVWMCICMCIHMCMDVYLYLYVYLYIHTHTHI